MDPSLTELIADVVAAIGAELKLKVPTSRTVAGKPLSANVTLAKADVGLGSVDNTADSAKVVASAAKLTTSRTINGVAFDGTANVTIAVGDVTTSGVQTLTNKRIVRRVGTVTSSATPAINTDLYDQFNITALAVAITSMSSGLSGTAGDGQPLLLRIKDNGTARAITWGASWRTLGVTLPTTTVVGKTLYVGAVRNAADSIWDVVYVGQQA